MVTIAYDTLDLVYLSLNLTFSGDNICKTLMKTKSAKNLNGVNTFFKWKTTVSNDDIYSIIVSVLICAVKCHLSTLGVYMIKYYQDINCSKFTFKDLRYCNVLYMWITDHAWFKMSGLYIYIK